METAASKTADASASLTPNTPSNYFPFPLVHIAIPPFTLTMIAYHPLYLSLTMLLLGSALAAPYQGISQAGQDISIASHTIVRRSDLSDNDFNDAHDYLQNYSPEQQSELLKHMESASPAFHSILLAKMASNQAVGYQQLARNSVSTDPTQTQVTQHYNTMAAKEEQEILKHTDKFKHRIGVREKKYRETS